MRGVGGIRRQSRRPAQGSPCCACGGLHTLHSVAAEQLVQPECCLGRGPGAPCCETCRTAESQQGSTARQFAMRCDSVGTSSTQMAAVTRHSSCLCALCKCALHRISRTAVTGRLSGRHHSRLRCRHGWRTTEGQQRDNRVSNRSVHACQVERQPCLAVAKPSCPAQVKLCSGRAARAPHLPGGAQSWR